MRFLRRLLARVANYVTRRQGDQRLREEMEEHLALQTAENLRAGMSPSEARREAVLKFGAREAIRENYHAEQGLPFLASEELTEVSLGATERVGTHPECERNSTLHLSRLAR